MTRIAATFRSAETDPRRVNDLRLVPVTVAAYAAAWCGAAISGTPALLLWTLLATSGITLLIRRRRRTTAAILIVAAGVGLAATARVTALHVGPLPHLAAARAKATMELVITDDAHTIAPTLPGRGPLTIIPARAEQLTVGASGQETSYRIRSPVTVMASSSSKFAKSAKSAGSSKSPTSPNIDELWRHLLPSTRVRVTGKLGPPGDGWPDAAILSTRLPPEIVAGPSLVQSIAGRLRQDLRDACVGLPEDQRGLIPGLVIGDVSQEPASLADAFRATGLTHLTAVSGENLVFLLGAAMPVARLAGARGRILTMIGVTVVVAFTLLARPEPSMVRASVMSLLGLFVLATGRRSRGIPLLCAGSLLLLLVDPWLARSYGFALSLAATAGLFILAPGWQQRLARHRIPHRIAESLACTAAAETFCLPILVSLTATITPLSLPANLLAEFCVGPATVLGAAALIAAALWLPLGQAFAWLAQWPTEAIVGVARYGSTLPGATVHWPSGGAGTCALLGLYAVAVVLAATVASRRRGVR